MFRGKLGSLRNVGSEKNIYGSAKKIKELSLKEKKNERKASIKKLTAEVHKEGVDVGDNLNTNMAKQIRTLMLIERMKKNFKKRRLKRKVRLGEHLSSALLEIQSFLRLPLSPGGGSQS